VLRLAGDCLQPVSQIDKVLERTVKTLFLDSIGVPSALEVFFVIVIINSHLYCASYNTCKDLWHITSNGDDKDNDNNDDNDIIII